MSEERFDRLEALIGNLNHRLDGLEVTVGDLYSRVNTMQGDINQIKTRMDTEGTLAETFERYFTQMMEQINRLPKADQRSTSELSRDNNRSLGEIEDRTERVERNQRRMNSRLLDLEQPHDPEESDS